LVEPVEILERAVVFQEDQKQKVNFPFITALVHKQEALNHMFQEVKGDLQKFQNEQTKVGKGYKNQGRNFNKYKGRYCLQQPLAYQSCKSGYKNKYS